MDTEVLRWFQQVSDGATVTEVSDLAMVSQSGVSRALARLEDEVGEQLLRRSGRTLRMTEAGVAFKRHVDVMIHQLDDGLAAVQQVIDPESGLVTLAFEPWLGPGWVPALVSGFRVEHPSVRFQMLTEHADMMATLRHRGDIDLELTTSRPSPSTFGWHSLARAPLHLAVSVNHPIASQPAVVLADLEESGFVAFREESSMRGVTDKMCAEVGVTPRIDFECDDLSTVLGFIAAGLGVAITPLPHGHREGFREADSVLRFLPISDASAALEIGVAWSLQHRLLPAAQAFLEHLRRPRGD